MVDNVDALTRLNRTQGVGMAQITHTMSDLRALSNAEDVAKACGFVERASAIIVGGLPSQELDDLSHVVPFTRAERDLITSWSTPPSWDDRQGPPGMGNFLFKSAADRDRRGRPAGHLGARGQRTPRDLLLAAAVGGRTLLEVYEWLANEATPVPGGLLRAHGYELLARTLRGTQDSPPETRGSVYFTARAATACLRDDQITAWVTPPSTPRIAPLAGGTDSRPGGALVEFCPEDFPGSRQTLYLLSKDEGGSAGPLVAALTDRVLRCGVAAAERTGGRLDPPMVLVLDEAANICRIADLPALYSHLGSRGIIPLTILQSYSQAVGVWGETGTKALWGAATIKLIGPGMDDPDFAEDLSRLIGDHDVLTVSRNSGGGRGGASRTHASRQQRILPASAVRELPKGRALLLATGAKPALLTLQPWYTGPRKDQIATAEAAARQQLTDRARATPVGGRQAIR